MNSSESICYKFWNVYMNKMNESGFLVLLIIHRKIINLWAEDPVEGCDHKNGINLQKTKKSAFTHRLI